jgi:hypothetical protein
VRNPNLAYAMRMHGDVGQIEVAQANVRNRLGPPRRRRRRGGRQPGRPALGERPPEIPGVHVMGAKTVAEAAKAAGVERLVQMSALGADEIQRLEVRPHQGRGRSRRPRRLPGRGRRAPVGGVRARTTSSSTSSPDGRPSPALPLIGGGHTRFQPVSVGDVARP